MGFLAVQFGRRTSLVPIEVDIRLDVGCYVKIVVSLMPLSPVLGRQNVHVNVFPCDLVPGDMGKGEGEKRGREKIGIMLDI